MKNNQNLLKLSVLAMLIALGVVISPILRFEGMCPMAHLINITCSVLMGPWYSLLCATVIGVIRMLTMAIPPIALTGAVFGAFLSGVLYKASKGNLIMAFLGEVVGTGIIGALISYPVMSFIWGKNDINLFFYLPTFIPGTLIGGSIAYVFLKKLSSNGMLAVFQKKLSGFAYEDKSTTVGNSISIAAFGVICYVVIRLLTGFFKMTSPVWGILSYIALAVFVAAAMIYYVMKREKKNDKDEFCGKTV